VVGKRLLCRRQEAEGKEESCKEKGIMVVLPDIIYDSRHIY
jgi:hypothetical protein